MNQALERFAVRPVSENKNSLAKDMETGDRPAEHRCGLCSLACSNGTSIRHSIKLSAGVQETLDCKGRIYQSSTYRNNYRTEILKSRNIFLAASACSSVGTGTSFNG